MKRLALVLCSLLVLTALPLAAQVTFTVTGYTTGDGSNSVVTGDFDRDGKPDFATSAFYAGSVSIYRNVGGGKFALKSEVSINHPIEVRTADVNGDGKLDLVIGTDLPRLSIFLGNGDGTFHFLGTVELHTELRYIELGDVNNDGKVDIVSDECTFVKDFSFCSLRTYKNNGTGTFTLYKALITDSTTTAAGAVPPLAIADFNRDGRNDIVFLASGGFMIFTNTGAGFAPPVLKSTGGAGSIAVGSFNKSDTALDIVVATPAPCSGLPCPLYASVYLNDGAGHFNGLRSRTRMFGNTLLVTDLNGDGIADIVGLSGSHFYPAQQYILGNNDGTFKAPVSWGGNDTGGQPVARDVNLDGRHDLLFAEFVPGDTAVYMNSNAAVICAPPGSGALQAKICGPTSGSTVGTTFTVRASGNSPAGVKRLELWIDGKKRTESWSDQLRASVSVAAGAHRVSIVAVDQFKNYATRAITVTAK